MSRDLKAQLDSSQMLLANAEQLVEHLSQRPSPKAIIEKFKEVYEEFPGIHSMFLEFVQKTFGQEYVVPFTGGE
ncbi:hypothetical protein LIER_23211 [Lithospermum erythrorhizon]|uniref:Uncharacterized protein n=1 Tax=Lithospermum erythrorhizon TaxID=34254 RepID=A0AAV3R279_LITER